MTKPTTNPSASAVSQQEQQARQAGESPTKARKQVEESDEIQYFDTTITKFVERENADGDKEWVEVMSDNLYPGERLKRDEDAERDARKDELARAQAYDAAAKRKQTEEEILKNKREADLSNKDK